MAHKQNLYLALIWWQQPCVSMSPSLEKEAISQFLPADLTEVAGGRNSNSRLLRQQQQHSPRLDSFREGNKIWVTPLQYGYYFTEQALEQKPRYLCCLYWNKFAKILHTWQIWGVVIAWVFWCPVLFLFFFAEYTTNILWFFEKSLYALLEKKIRLTRMLHFLISLRKIKLKSFL